MRADRRLPDRLMITMKGLPLAYSKDMQDDKPPVFEAASLLDAVPRGDDRHGRGRTFRTERMRAAAELGYATATDLADWLVRAGRHPVPRGAPHHRRGGEAGRKPGVALDQLPLADLRRSTRGSTSGSLPRCRSRPRSRRAPAMAEPRPIR
jgi:argininosuccinate lyase